jgi:predicted metallopeptidase
MGRGRKKNVEKEDATYSIVEEANEIIKKLAEKYPDILWAIGDPKTIQVYGVDNKEKPASSDTLAKIRSVAGVMKAVLEKNNINLKFIIEVYWSDYREWSLYKKQWVLFHELLHVCDPESKKMRKHNIEDFSLIIDKIGISRYNSDGLVDLLGEKPVEFDKKIIAQMMKPVEDTSEDDTPTPPDA